MAHAYDLSSIGGPQAMMPPAIQVYTEKETRYLPPQAIVLNSEYVILSTGNSTAFNSELEQEVQHQYVPTLMDVEDCVVKCQNVLGLKIQEIAKILGISRATLDLHRKGKVKDFTPYLTLNSFVHKIEQKYSQDIQKAMRSVLIERKTLVQHMTQNRNELDKTLPYFEKASEKLASITLTKSQVDPDVAATRLAGIRKMG